jgi:hypothetical protein
VKQNVVNQTKEVPDADDGSVKGAVIDAAD